MRSWGWQGEKLWKAISTKLQVLFFPTTSLTHPQLTPIQERGKELPLSPFSSFYLIHPMLLGTHTPNWSNKWLTVLAVSEITTMTATASTPSPGLTHASTQLFVLYFVLRYKERQRMSWLIPSSFCTLLCLLLCLLLCFQGADLDMVPDQAPLPSSI